MSGKIRAGAIDLLDAFALKVREQPTVPAVMDNGTAISYEEIDSLSCQISGAIRQTASTLCPRVLLAVPASARAYAAMIGTLHAGGTFCPVNIEGPEDRNALIARLYNPDVLLFENSPPAFFKNLPVIIPSVDLSRLGTHQRSNSSTEYSEIAYVVFTSGTTGQPKGVKIGRAGFSRFLNTARACFELVPGERWGQFSNLGYDLAIMDVFLTLTGGGTLIPLTSRKDRLMPAVAIKEKQIAVWQSVPSVLDFMIETKQLTVEHLASLRLMSFCGEPLLPRQLDSLFLARPDLSVLNTYGTTETTGFNTLNLLTASNYRASCEASTVALGADLPGWRLSLYGSDPVQGEIVVSSENLALGYWGDEERTRNAFRLVRQPGGQNCRSYFTGDWGVLKNSQLYCAGRIDRQIKIFGERIELDEIDCLLRESGFPLAYTIHRDGVLHSFVESVDAVDEERVRELLSKRLPFHSVPKTVRALPSLPRNANGKIDRQKLGELIPS